MRLKYPSAVLAALLSINVPASETEPAVGDDSETVQTQSPDLALAVTEYRKLSFATASVILLVWFAVGWREAISPRR